ncbi:Uncharacterised protein [Mycobacteroides abscessus subsp. abscessus]|nr:Uncharacterised protein [Mycobacteroides abscessus subsp. abscessus]
MLVINSPITMAHNTYSISGTVQCCALARSFHQICAYLPSSPTPMSSRMPGT